MKKQWENAQRLGNQLILVINEHAENYTAIEMVLACSMLKSAMLQSSVIAQGVEDTEKLKALVADYESADWEQFLAECQPDEDLIRDAISKVTKRK